MLGFEISNPLGRGFPETIHEWRPGRGNSRFALTPKSRCPQLLAGLRIGSECRPTRHPTNYLCIFNSLINSPTRESGLTGSTMTICWGLIYMRSGPCHSLPRLSRMLFCCLVWGSTVD